VTSSQPGQPEPTVPLASQYGTCGGKAAYARKTSTGSWQVKVHDPTNLARRAAGVAEAEAECP